MEQPSGRTKTPGTATPRLSPGGSGRRPGHSVTREQIARAAREQFAAGGYDRVTMRSIAAQAGVDAALVAYFFGSKRELFDEVTVLSFDSAALRAQLLDGDSRDVGERLARCLIEALDEAGRRQRILAIIRTAGVEADTARMIRDKFTTGCWNRSCPSSEPGRHHCAPCSSCRRSWALPWLATSSDSKI